MTTEYPSETISSILVPLYKKGFYMTYKELLLLEFWMCYEGAINQDFYNLAVEFGIYNSSQSVRNTLNKFKKANIKVKNYKLLLN